MIELLETSTVWLAPLIRTSSISFVELTTDFVVKVQLSGACHTCPMSIQTLKFGVEQSLKNSIPEIKSVEAVDFSM